MRELLVDTCTGEEEDGTAHSFQYYILVDEMELGGGLSCESYGVKVAGPDGEEASVPNITVSVPNKALLAKRILLCSLFAGKETG